jgi:hypothetical protein
MVLDTSADDKRLITAVLPSTSGGARVSEAGQRVIEAAISHQDAQQQQPSRFGAMYQVHVRSASEAGGTVARVLGSAIEGAVVIFMGADECVCAELMKALCLLPPPAARASNCIRFDHLP